MPLQYFTFHRKADRLRADVRTWQIAISAEAAIMVAMGLAVPPPASIYILAITPFYFAFVWWLYSRPLRRRHSLAETLLTLVDSSGTRPSGSPRSIPRPSCPSRWAALPSPTSPCCAATTT